VTVQATGAVGRSALLRATSQFAESGLARGVDVVVADALVPFVPTLLAMGHSDQAICAPARMDSQHAKPGQVRTRQRGPPVQRQVYSDLRLRY